MTAGLTLDRCVWEKREKIDDRANLRSTLANDFQGVNLDLNQVPFRGNWRNLEDE